MKLYVEMRSLQDLGFSKSRIAKKMNVSRGRVSAFLKMDYEEFKEFEAAFGNRRKKLDPYREQILGWLQEHPDLSGAQVFDWIQERLAMTDVQENTVRNYVNELRETYHIPKAIQRREYSAVPETRIGQQAQVDFGQTVAKTTGGESRRLYFIAFVLSHSRYKYVEWLDRPFRTADMVQCHENAFRYFGGMPSEMVYDQDALLSVSENAGDLVLTSAFSRYHKTRGFSIYLCRKSDPESKGKVEQVVKFVKNNFSKNRVFSTIADWNGATIAWLARTGNHKVHHNTKKRPAEVHALEKPHLQRVSGTYIFEKVLESSITRNIQKDNVIRYDGNRYSVPRGTYRTGERNQAVVRIEGDRLCICLEATGEVLAHHAVARGKGILVSDPSHHAREATRKERMAAEVREIFSDREMAAWFLESLEAKYPRHLIDQMTVVLRTATLHPQHCDEALAEVRRLNLVSGNDSRDIAVHLATVAGKKTTLLPQVNEKYKTLKAPERKQDVYVELLKGGMVR